MQRGLIKPELSFQLGDKFRRQATRARIFAVGAEVFQHVIARTREALEHVALAFHIGDDLFNRAAGDKLREREIHDHDAQQCRDHQQEPSEDICQHARSALALSQTHKAPAAFNAAALSALNHQKSK